jgi:sugar transferase (PEP-CTERM system associated)
MDLGMAITGAPPDDTDGAFTAGRDRSPAPPSLHPPGGQALERTAAAPRHLTAGRALFLLDLVAAVLVTGLFLYAGCRGASCAAAPRDVAALAVFPVANIAALFALGLYRRDALIDTRAAVRRIPLAAGLGAAGALVVCTLAAIGLGAAPWLAQAAALAPFGFGSGAAGVRLVFSVLRDRNVFGRRIIVLGAGRRAWDLAWLLRKEGRTPHYDVTFVHDVALGPVDPRLLRENPGRIVYVQTRDLLPVAQRLQADQIVVAPDERRGMALEPLLACKASGFPVTEYLTFLEHEIRRVDVKRIEVGWLLYSPGFTFGTLDRALKRLMDILVSAAFLVAATPMLAAAAIAIKLGDRGPVFYSQDRVTRGGRLFRIYKLRTMRRDAERTGAVWAAQRDPRVTPVGRLLRATRVDELPQLWNVLRGDMSLVGPRPERPEFVDQLAAQLPLYHERHHVKAGLTGWAQINYPYGASIDDARSKLSYDLYYVKNFGILFDMLIILQTLRVVLTPSGAR